MNIINKLTIRQLFLNKKRTLVTIIGTIISTAMITAVATLGLSFMDLMQRQVISQNGEWHVTYKNINEHQLTEIEKNKHVETAMMNRESGYAYLKGSKNTNKPYLYIIEYSQSMFQHMPVKLIEGRLPQKANEILLSEAVSKNAGVTYKVGDQIKLSIGKRFSTLKDADKTVPLQQNSSLHWDNDNVTEKFVTETTKTYTVVGFIERPEWELTWSPGYTTISYIDQNSVNGNDTFDVSVIFNKINNKLFSWGDKIAKDNKIDVYEYNNSLLRFYGIIKDDTTKSMLTTLSIIIMVIIVIGSVSLIYNAFAISVSERLRYLGMLSSVGATKKQKRNSVFFEGAVIGAISIPIGILAGYIGLGITYLCINPMLESMLTQMGGFRLIVYPSSVITAFVVSALTILISTYIPARKASNVSAIDAIRQVSDVKISRRQVKTSRLTRMIFGMEGELGLKNLKRYKARYKATVFSLVISMILFLVVSAFTDNLRKSLTMSQVGVNYDVEVRIDSQVGDAKDNIIKKIKSLDNITKISTAMNWNVTTMVDPKNIADFLKADSSQMLQDGKYPYEVVLTVLDDKNLEEYAKKVGVDKKQLEDKNQPSAILIDTVTYKDKVTEKYIETKCIKTNVGDLFNLGIRNEDTSIDKVLPQIKVAALTKEMPMGMLSSGDAAYFNMIISKETLNQLLKGVGSKSKPIINTYIYLNSDKPMELQNQLEAIQNEVGMGSMNIDNVYYYKQNEQQSVLLLSVFTYAFIILITAICVANIFNTISTSIALRKREFAMLKSIGITPKGFNKMLNYESIFYGIKALLYGIPISIFVMYIIYDVLMAKFDFKFTLPIGNIAIVIVSVFFIVGMAMLYSSSKVRKENIIDALKQEII